MRRSPKLKEILSRISKSEPQPAHILTWTVSIVQPVQSQISLLNLCSVVRPSVKRFPVRSVMLWLPRFRGAYGHVYTNVSVCFYWLVKIRWRVIPSELEASAAPNRVGAAGPRECDALESGIGKSSIWNHSPSSSGELTPKRLCSAVLVVAVDLALDFGLGLGARGTYGTIFIGNEGAKEVLQEEAIFGVEIC